MNEKNTKYLVEKYPRLYRGKDLPITQNLLPFGIETGDGWFDIIDQLSAEITRLDEESITDTLAVQVKEKYGGLRFYISGGDSRVDEAIEYAENKSLETCEVCGEPGRERGTSWIYTMCDKCWKEHTDE